MRACVYVCVCACVHMYVCMHSCVCVCVCLSVCVCAYIGMCLQHSVSMYTCHPMNYSINCTPPMRVLGLLRATKSR